MLHGPKLSHDHLGSTPAARITDAELPAVTRVQRAFQRAFDVDPASISLETQPEDVAQWDSLGHATLAYTLEQEFNVRFDVDELMAMENVRTILTVIGHKLDAGTGNPQGI